MHGTMVSMNKYKKKYKNSKRGKFAERLWRRLSHWRKVHKCKTKIDLDHFIDRYCDCEACEYCGEKGVKLFFRLCNSFRLRNKRRKATITIDDIDLICQECLYNEISK